MLRPSPGGQAPTGAPQTPATRASTMSAGAAWGIRTSAPSLPQPPPVSSRLSNALHGFFAFHTPPPPPHFLSSPTRTLSPSRLPSRATVSIYRPASCALLPPAPPRPAPVRRRREHHGALPAPVRPVQRPPVPQQVRALPPVAPQRQLHHARGAVHGGGQQPGGVAWGGRKGVGGTGRSGVMTQLQTSHGVDRLDAVAVRCGCSVECWAATCRFT